MSFKNCVTLAVSVALCRISPGHINWEATVTAVKLSVTLPPASKVVSRLCSSWKMCFLTALCMRAKIMENPPNPRIINNADSYFSRTGLTLQDETNDLGTYFVWFDSLRPFLFSHVRTGVFLVIISTSVLLKDTTQCFLWGSNPQPLDLESSTLPVSHRTPFLDTYGICDLVAHTSFKNGFSTKSHSLKHARQHFP